MMKFIEIKQLSDQPASINVSEISSFREWAVADKEDVYKHVTEIRTKDGGVYYTDVTLYKKLKFLFNFVTV